ncbi:hypothetical protein DFH11DRAFT_1585762 [Phellopilus nigrolimitatus]|nr:hypothetical protein DFH11DRAFT_1585762 [Phellopilus nigrolimitatus]
MVSRARARACTHFPRRARFLSLLLLCWRLANSRRRSRVEERGGALGDGAVCACRYEDDDRPGPDPDWWVGCACAASLRADHSASYSSVDPEEPPLRARQERRAGAPRR